MLGAEVEVIRKAISSGGNSKYSANIVYDRLVRMKVDGALKSTGRTVGFIGAGFQMIEAYDDKFISPGEQLKVLISTVTVFLPPPFSIGFAILDTGFAMVSGKSITDRIGEGYDEFYNEIKR